MERTETAPSIYLLKPAFQASLRPLARMLARKGWRKSPAHTPKEFLIRIQDDAMRNAVAEFTRHYESARFGGSAQDAQRLPDLYEEVSTAAGR